MIAEKDIWQAANLMIRRYGEDAAAEAERRADQLRREGELAGSLTWQRILTAIGKLQQMTPEGPVH
jgi:hypothetical protein